MTSPVSDAVSGFAPVTGSDFEAQIVRREAIVPVERDAMCRLLDEHFQNVSASSFERDLEEKDWVILIKDRARGELHGFTTLMRFTCPTRPGVVALFSGDTIVRRGAWNETVLARAWARLAFRLAAMEGEAVVYWFLICSGYRTYRFLPVFFREFFPRFDAVTPGETKALLEALAAEKFGGQFDAVHGLVRPSMPAPLRERLNEDAPRSDEHVRFFLTANPRHWQGDELVCLAPLRLENLTAAGRRMVRS